MNRRTRKKIVDQAKRSEGSALLDGNVLPERSGRSLIFCLCLFLFAIAWIAFGQTIRHEFVNYDDHNYVVGNDAVNQGVTLAGIVRVFTEIHSANWHPITWLSHMVDCEFYGLKPGGHHLTNVLLHAGAAILLFLVLYQMTSFLWRSAFAAALFAVHPLRVESVAWVAERKDVLSGVLFLLVLMAYTRFVRSRSRTCYGLVIFLFALGLMCKPMLVTLPFVLLLLDYWPFKRAACSNTTGGWRRLSIPVLVEKLPLLGLALVSCLVTLLGQRDSISAEERIPLSLRLANAVVSATVYLRQMFYPAGLTVFYPYPRNGLPPLLIISALLILVSISVAGFLWRQKRPWLLCGWLWYIIMLAPVIGVVQVGAQAHADRYTYLPQIGLYIIFTWTIAEWSASWRHRRIVLGVGASLLLAMLLLLTNAQTAHWKNSESLWTRALESSDGNYVAHNNLGTVLQSRGRVNEAVAHFQRAIAIMPRDPQAYNNFGNCLMRSGSIDEAIAQYGEAVKVDPNFAKGYYNLGTALLRKGAIDGAISQYQKAIGIKEHYALAHFGLGNALMSKGLVSEAKFQFKKANEIEPNFAGAYTALGNALLREGNIDEAVGLYEKAVQLNGNDSEARFRLGEALAKKGRPEEAMAHLELDHENSSRNSGRP